MKLSKLFFLLTALLLSSCFLPEKFTATLNVTKDYGYTFEYDGLLVFGPALGEIAKNGSLPQKADDEMRQGTAKTFKKEEGFESAVYQGKGRWKVRFKKIGTIGTVTKLFSDGLPIVTLRRNADGAVSVEGISVDAKIAKQLKAVKFVIDGKLEVTTEMPVVSHNATGTPKFFEMIGSYEWTISSENLTSPRMMLSAQVSTKTPHKSEGQGINNFDEDKYLGLWKYCDGPVSVIFKITKVGFGDYKFSHHAYKYKGQIVWPEPTIENSDGIHLKPLRGILAGHFISANYWATHAQDHSVEITIEAKPNGALLYSERGVIGRRTNIFKGMPSVVHEATKISSNVNEDSDDIPDPENRTGATGCTSSIPSVAKQSISPFDDGKSSEHIIPKQFQGHWALTKKDCQGSDPGAEFTITPLEICYEDGCDKFKKLISSDKNKILACTDRQCKYKIFLRLDNGKLWHSQDGKGGMHVRCK